MGLDPSDFSDALPPDPPTLWEQYARILGVNPFRVESVPGKPGPYTHTFTPARSIGRSDPGGIRGLTIHHAVADKVPYHATVTPDGTLTWNHPDSDPIGDIKKAMREMVLKSSITTEQARKLLGDTFLP